MPARALVLFVATVLGGVLPGCDNAFEPRTEGPPYFSVYGTLDALSDTQVVRVEDVEAVFDTTTTVLGARVTLSDPVSGEVVVGRDSVLTLSDGSRAFAVLFATSIQDDRTYTLTAERLEQPSARTVVEVTVGGPPPLAVFPPGEINGFLSQNISLNQDVRTFSSIQVRYTLDVTATGQTYTTLIPLAARPFSGGIGVTVPLSIHLRAIRNELEIGLSDPDALALRQMALTFVQTQRSGAIIQDGLGEVGWRTTTVAPWRLDAATVLDLALLDAQDG